MKIKEVNQQNQSSKASASCRASDGRILREEEGSGPLRVERPGTGLLPHDGGRRTAVRETGHAEGCTQGQGRASGGALWEKEKGWNEDWEM